MICYPFLTISLVETLLGLGLAEEHISHVEVPQDFVEAQRDVDESQLFCCPKNARTLLDWFLSVRSALKCLEVEECHC